MINILSFFVNEFDASSFYRGIGPIGDLYKEGIRSSITDRVHWTILKGYDLLFILRPFLKNHIDGIKAAKDCNKNVWIDYDDLLIDVPAHNNFMKHIKNNLNMSKYDLRNNIIEAVKLADLVTVSTDHIKKRLITELDKDNFHHNNIHVINNAHDNFMLHKEQIESDKVILWRGTNTHSKDLDTVKEQVIYLAEKNTDYKFLFAGYDHTPITKHIKNKQILKPVDVMKYFKLIKKWKPRLVLVPLEINDFNLAKSNIAGLEANYFGGVAVAPKMQEWLEVASTYQDSHENVNDFYHKAQLLIDNDEYFMLENKRIYNNIKNNYLLSNLNKKRAKLVKDLVNRSNKEFGEYLW